VVNEAKINTSQRKLPCHWAKKEPAKILARAKGKVRSLTACSQASFFDLMLLFKEKG
jgi:hypothetical protein